MIKLRNVEKSYKTGAGETFVLRFRVPEGSTTSVGHAAPEPSQVSSTSHSPEALRQDVPEDATAHAAVQQASLEEHTAPAASSQVAPSQQGSSVVQSSEPQSHSSPDSTMPP